MASDANATAATDDDAEPGQTQTSAGRCHAIESEPRPRATKTTNTNRSTRKQIKTTTTTEQINRPARGEQVATSACRHDGRPDQIYDRGAELGGPRNGSPAAVAVQQSPPPPPPQLPPSRKSEANCLGYLLALFSLLLFAAVSYCSGRPGLRAGRARSQLAPGAAQEPRRRRARRRTRSRGAHPKTVIRHEDDFCQPSTTTTTTTAHLRATQGDERRNESFKSETVTSSGPSSAPAELGHAERAEEPNVEQVGPSGVRSMSSRPSPSACDRKQEEPTTTTRGLSGPGRQSQKLRNSSARTSALKFLLASLVLAPWAHQLLGPLPAVRPASAMLLVTQQMIAPQQPPPGANLTTGPSSSLSTTDEFSRAVLATMSTQSSVAPGTPGEQQRLARTRRLLQEDSEGPEQAAGGATARAASFSGPASEEVPPPYGLEGDSPQVGGSGGGGGSTVSLHAEPDDELQAGRSPSSGQNASNQLALSTGTGGGTELVPSAGTNNKLASIFDDVTDFSRIFAMVAIMIGDICGNSLVILSVVRHSKLRVTTNWFVVSLACADILVALFAMTFNVTVQITGRWVFPPWVCDFWNSCDVMASTASILHLCCISIDRYYAIMRPLDYPMKITTKRVCYALAVVWISSALLSFIPIFTGIYTTSEHIKFQLEHPDQCDFVVNRVYALVSSSISFWIPCCIMVFTYYRIYKEASRQEKSIYKAQNMLPAPQVNHHHHHHHSSSSSRAKQHRSKSMAITSLSSSSGGGGGKSKSDQANKIQAFAKQTINELKPEGQPAGRPNDDLLPGPNNNNKPTANNLPNEQQPLTGSALDLNNNSGPAASGQQGQTQQPQQSSGAKSSKAPLAKAKAKQSFQPASQSNNNNNDDDDDRDSNSGQSTPTKGSISKMKREHKAAKTLGIIMGVFILCWLPFFSWYTPQHICGSACEDIIPKSLVTLLFWIGYFNSTLNPIIYAYFNHEFRDAFKKTLQWIFCCCRDLKCLRVNRPNDNQHYNCTYRSTQEIGLVTNG